MTWFRQKDQLAAPALPVSITGIRERVLPTSNEDRLKDIPGADHRDSAIGLPTASFDSLSAIARAFYVLDSRDLSNKDLAQWLTNTSHDYLTTKQNDVELYQISHASENDLLHRYGNLSAARDRRDKLASGEGTHYGRQRKKVRESISHLKELDSSHYGVRKLIDEALSTHPSSDSSNPVVIDVNTLVEAQFQRLATRTLTHVFGVLGGWNTDARGFGTRYPSREEVRQGVEAFLRFTQTEDGVTRTGLMRGLSLVAAIASSDILFSSEASTQYEFITEVFGHASDIHSIIAERNPDDFSPRSNLEAAWQRIYSQVIGEPRIVEETLPYGWNVGVAGFKGDVTVRENIGKISPSMVVRGSDINVTIDHSAIIGDHPFRHVSIRRADGNMVNVPLEQGQLSIDSELVPFAFQPGDTLVLSTNEINVDLGFASDPNYTAARLQAGLKDPTERVMVINWPPYDRAKGESVPAALRRITV